MSGDISGAMSMAPMTTAVESARTPSAPMVDAKAMRERNRVNRCVRSGPS
jgi:hypothetical protein